MRMHWIITLSLLTSLSLASIPTVSAETNTIYSDYQQLLNRHLLKHEPDGGGLITAFDYDQALSDPQLQTLLSDQRNRLKSFDVSTLDSREKAVAFWINAYNFFMLDHLLSDALDNGELVDSVRDYGHIFNPYRVFGRDLFDVGGRKYSLSEIEKEILLGDQFKQREWFDARVHFAVNCASVGCPPLRQNIYHSERIDQQLEDSTRRALATDLHLRISGNTLYLSQLFDWYEDDYVIHSGSIEAFIEAHVDAATFEQVQATSRTRDIRYDWDLNRPGNFAVDFE